MNPPRIGAAAIAVCALVFISSGACHDFRSSSAPDPTSASRARVPFSSIVDGAHASGDGNPHFYFLPPLVQSPHYAGEADPAQSPTVVVCEWSTLNGGSCGTILASFERRDDGQNDSDIKYSSGGEFYHVTWHVDKCMTGSCTLDPGKTYRLRVLVGALELGHIDVLATSSTAGDGTGATNLELNGGAIPIPFRIEKGAVPPSSANPGLLPRATGQHPAAGTYGRSSAAGQTYADPLTGVTVLKLTDAATPTANSGMYHGYSEGGPMISQPWTGSDGETYYTAVVGGWLVDIKYASLQLTNWRRVSYWGEIGFAFSLNPATPRIAYVGSSTRVDRYNTATNQIENTGNWPWTVSQAGEYLDWLQTQLNDRWIVGMTRSNNTILALRPSDNLQRVVTVNDAGVATDEPHLDREFPQIYITSSSPSGVKNKIFNLEDNSFTVPNDPNGIVEDSHGAALRGKIVAVGNWTANAVVATYRDGTVRPVVTPSPTDINGDYHLAGQWVFDNPNEYFVVDQWKRAGAYAIAQGMIGFASTGGDVRLIAASDAVGSDYESGGQPHPTLAPDGKLVMWTSNMNGSTRYDTFIAKIPAK